MSKKNILPKHSQKTFVCPHCGTLSEMLYSCVSYYSTGELKGITEDFPQTNDVVWIATCRCCKKKIIWINEEYTYPDIVPEKAHDDMPESIKQIYNEAGLIFNKSPRAACALLRLAIDLLCDELQAEGTKLNDKIGSLVKRGLSQKIQQALDAVRVIGNDAVHPGQIIDINVDDRETAITLMRILNIIVADVISNNQLIHDIYEGLSESAKQQIGRRDKK